MRRFTQSLLIVMLLSFLFVLPVIAGGLKIVYGYAGKLGRYGIADTAVALYSGKGYTDLKIGTAEALEIIPKSPGPHHIKIKETHYNPDGSVMHEGYLEFKFGYGGGTLIKEEHIKGTKLNHIFGGWPAGN